MNRCLHITINDGAAAGPRRAATFGPGRPGTDPGSDYIMPDPDDPKSDYVMPDPDDPGSDYVMPDPDDPHYNPYFYGPSATPNGYGAVVASVCSCGCAAPSCQGTAADGGDTKKNPFVTPRDYSGFVIVRMAEGVVGDSPAQNLWALAELHAPKLTGLQAVLELALEAEEEKEGQEEEKKTGPVGPLRRLIGGRKPPPDGEAVADPPEPPAGALVSRPLVELQGGYGRLLPRSESLGILRKLEEKTALTAFPPLHSLTAYWRLDLREYPSLVEEVVARLNRLAEVDLAYREITALDSQATTAKSGKLFAEDQGYLEDGPSGISASWAWMSLGDAPPNFQLTLCDLEQGWNPDHEDLQANVKPDILYGANRAKPNEGSTGDHGTAVLGQLVAAGNGVKGAAAGLGQLVLASHYKSKSETHPFAGTNGHVAAAIAQALAKPVAGPLGEGDILLLEVQRGLLPAEVDEADFEAIRLAAGLGVIVVEAAGNGGFDLDRYSDPDTGRTLRRGDSHFRDSGAILVGAARAALPHDRAPFSNYGSRLDCFAWGEKVTTCGYGDLAGTTATDVYTNSFNGTSSASPIIAGAAALLQALHLKQAQVKLGPQAMRALLSDPATGTRQGPNVSGPIGVMPDLKAIVRGRLQLVPDVYMRRSIGDDGSPFSPGDEISSSPDILLWKGAEAAIQRFGEGPRANTSAPGTPIDPGNPNSIYQGSNKLHLRMRNRGGGEGAAKVRIFASPAATFITPERWLPIGSIAVKNIPQGDTLVVSPPLVVNLPMAWSQDAASWDQGIVPAYSFLAVQLPADDAPPHPAGLERAVLPPGPPYFDLTEFLSFLHGPGVAWRNVHPVQPGTDDMTMAFLLAGTPDRARRFDFEVIQRLPAGASVTLKVPDALAAKLRQRQPWLANGGLVLPHRPRTALGQVELAPGVCAHAAFRVKIGSAPLLGGHSLAIRQLWRGEEVGRITWWFA